jgi:site-specific recombinase XerD
MSLPAHESWPGAKFRYCGRANCTEALRKHDHGRYVAPNTVICEAAGCSNYLPEGFYRGGASYACCSGACWKDCRIRAKNEGYAKNNAQRKQTRLEVVPTNPKKQYKRKAIWELVPPAFQSVVEQYFTDFVPLHYRDQGSVRSALGRLFRYLGEAGCTSLDDVDPGMITKFRTWTTKDGRGVKTDLLPCISTFFKWCNMVGLRKAGNPVNPFLHFTKKKVSVPRPLSDTEQTLAWQLMHERGDARLRLVLAIAEESGMRIGEICRLRVSDVDAKGQRLFVRTPNKCNRERYAHFGPRTAKYLPEWLAERDAACGHDRLLYNHSRRMSAFTSKSLGQAMSFVLCKTYGGEVLHETGFQKWCTHRLRHTMATKLVAGGADAAVVMGAGGWIDPDAMAAYVKVNEDQSKLGYAKAMRRAEQQRQQVPKMKILSPEDFLKHVYEGELPATNKPESHCV